MSFSIPKNFDLGGQTFTVRLESQELETGKAGLCNYDQGWVRIATKTRYGPVPEDAQLRIFCHEMLHLLFDAAGEREISNDEATVDRCATLLAQILRSAR